MTDTANNDEPTTPTPEQIAVTSAWLHELATTVGEEARILAVDTLLSQPSPSTPSAEARTYSAVEVQDAFERGVIRGEQDANERNHSRRQYEQMHASEPVHIEDMAPGTTFDADRAADGVTFRWRWDEDGLHMYGLLLGWMLVSDNASGINPSTIRNVTPPPALPNQED